MPRCFYSSTFGKCVVSIEKYSHDFCVCLVVFSGKTKQGGEIIFIKGWLGSFITINLSSVYNRNIDMITHIYRLVN